MDWSIRSTEKEEGKMKRGGVAWGTDRLDRVTRRYMVGSGVSVLNCSSPPLPYAFACSPHHHHHHHDGGLCRRPTFPSLTCPILHDKPHRHVEVR
ncbi:hypothetical protein B296_00055781 [Ensete ventricosum]|uniref:Uncharacterized protein n=1 Tax=Ensete ventricosum TaxID=4639 RepID=A0A426WWC2_ENSVE|nr:hypothetical protein B296_00055781 [Ensete ventricosum]